MKKLMATLVVSTFILTGCTFGHGGDVLVKVNNEPITQKQFDTAYNKAVKNSVFKSAKLDTSKDDGNILYLMMKDRIINELIIKTLLNQELEKRNIKVTKEDTENELKEMIDAVGSKELFNERLKQSGISNAQFKESLKEEVKMKKLTEAIGVPSVSDKDVQNFYKQNISKFKYPDMVRASHILIMADPIEIKSSLRAKNPKISDTELKAKVDEEMAKRLSRANEILAEVNKNPNNFDGIARDKSDDTVSAKQGGDLGFFAKQDMVEEFSKAAFSMQPNTVSGLVKSKYGYHIIKVTDRMAAGQEPFEKVKDRIKSYLINKNQVEVLEKFVESIKKNANIEFVDKEYNPESIVKKIKKQTNPSEVKKG